jgi:hypothetical protein
MAVNKKVVVIGAITLIGMTLYSMGYISGKKVEYVDNKGADTVTKDENTVAATPPAFIPLEYSQTFIDNIETRPDSLIDLLILGNAIPVVTIPQFSKLITGTPAFFPSPSDFLEV